MSELITPEQCEARRKECGEKKVPVTTFWTLLIIFIGLVGGIVGFSIIRSESAAAKAIVKSDCAYEKSIKIEATQDVINAKLDHILDILARNNEKK